MNLKLYDFTKKKDVRIAIDLLNHLLSDCMISASYFGELAHGDEKSGDMVKAREKAFEYWIGMHNVLHRVMQDQGQNKEAISLFGVYWSLFDFQRQKLHSFIAEDSYDECVDSLTLRKEEYGMPHYFTREHRDYMNRIQGVK